MSFWHGAIFGADWNSADWYVWLISRYATVFVVLVLCWLESIAFKVTTLQQYRNEFIRPLSLDIVGDCFMFSGCLSVSFVRFFRPDLFPQSHEWLEQYRHIHREYSLMTWLDSGGQRSRSQHGSSYSCHYDYQYLACSAPRYAELTVAW